MDEGKILESNKGSIDRFKEISGNYGELFDEVFAEQGLDYRKFEESVYNQVSIVRPDFENVAILDIGIGDGATAEPFIKKGAKKIVGIDLNPDMLEAARIKLGDKVKLLQMDATKLDFSRGSFPIIIAGAAIHNIPKEDRKKFWQEVLRLSPDLLVLAEKIADPDPDKHKRLYDSEVAAIRKVYGEKHSLHVAEAEWVDHYEYDERERLEIEEIVENLQAEYDVNIAEEVGMYKTIIAKRKIN